MKSDTFTGARVTEFQLHGMEPGATDRERLCEPGICAISEIPYKWVLDRGEVHSDLMGAAGL